jgi:hypothetical protein
MAVTIFGVGGGWIVAIAREEVYWCLLLCTDIAKFLKNLVSGTGDRAARQLPKDGGLPHLHSQGDAHLREEFSSINSTILHLHSAPLFQCSLRALLKPLVLTSTLYCVQRAECVSHLHLPDERQPPIANYAA